MQLALMPDVLVTGTAIDSFRLVGSLRGYYWTPTDEVRLQDKCTILHGDAFRRDYDFNLDNMEASTEPEVGVETHGRTLC